MTEGANIEGAKLYVGNLSYDTSDQTLGQYFGQAGTVVSATIIKDKMTGRSKGFGFVEMGSVDEANKAIEMFHEKDYEGRPLTVNVARPMTERAPRKFNNNDKNW